MTQALTPALPSWAQQLSPVDMDGAAYVLGVSRRFLIDALKVHPHYERRGSNYVFYPEHIAKLSYITSSEVPKTHRDVVRIFIAKRLPPKSIKPWEDFFEQNTDGYVYIIKCADRVKIGFTAKFLDRLRVLRTACPYPIEEIAVFRGNRHVEQYLHKVFLKLRRHGEWFENSGDLNSLVQELGAVVLDERA